MAKLARTVDFHPGETPGSFAGRLAAANGVSASDFGRDMGFRLPALDAGDPEALLALARLGGVDAAALQATAIVMREDGLWLGDAKVSRRNISRGKPRVCAACLEEDLARDHEARAETRAWYRVVWSIPFVRTCPVHRCLLAQPGDPRFAATSAVPDSLRRGHGWISDLARTSVTGPASPLEDWLATRLEGRAADSGLLAEFPFYVGVRLAEMAGATMLFGKEVAWSSLGERERVEAGASGFPVAQSAFEDFLVPFYDEWNRTKAIGAKGLGGSFMTWLQDNRKNPDYVALRSRVREHATDHLPLGPGDEFLGSVTRRTLHSICSASIEYGVHPKRLRKLLIQEGVVSAESADLTDARVVFEAKAAHALIAAAAGEIIGEEAREYLGMNRVQWDQMRGARLVDTLFTESDETHRAYSKAGLDAFLASVRYDKGDGDGLVPVSRAAKLAVCGYVDVVKLLRDSGLDRVGIDPARRGFAGILVDADEVKRKVSKPPLPGLTARQASKRLGVVIDTVHALTANGDLPSTMQQTYGGKREARLVRHEDVESFLTEYMPLSELARHLGVEKWPRHACRIMDEEGVAPAFTRETRRSVIYRRAEVEAVLAIPR